MTAPTLASIERELRELATQPGPYVEGVRPRDLTDLADDLAATVDALASLLAAASVFTFRAVPGEGRTGHRLRERFSDMDSYAIRVERRTGRDGWTDRWAITDGFAVWTRSGAWESEPLPSSRTDAYLRNARWTLDEALDQVPTLRAEMLADMEAGWPATGEATP